MRDTILIVDDMDINREILSEIVDDEYKVLEAANGREALDLLEEHNEEIAAMLLDLLMPEVDGFAVMDAVAGKEYMSKIPILVISGEDSTAVEKQCFSNGVSEFIHKPFDMILVKHRIDNIVSLFQYKNDLEQKVDIQTKVLREQYKLLEKKTEELRKGNENIVEILGNVVESRNLESGEHVKRVKAYTNILAKQIAEDCPEYELTDDKIRIITLASSLHDIGKISIPDNILLKPGRLTPEEFEVMKTHTTKGCEVLEHFESVWGGTEYDKASYNICRYHHERYDGKGYPDGLSGEDIPIEAQIVSIADVYDALVHERVYKAAVPKEEAYNMIMRGECGTFSEKLLSAFTRVKEQFENV
ncbi:MAG: response regulator [Clostridiales bacterium]|nr:response regulator [Clostridiales bacterium]